MSEHYSPFIPVWLDEFDLKPVQFRVLCHLWRRAGKNGRCFPSAPVIAASCRINRDTVWATLTALEEAGLLVKMKKRFGTANSYLLKVPIGGNEGPIESPQSAKKKSQSAETDGFQSAETKGRQSAETDGRKGSKGKGLKRNQTSTFGSNSAPVGTASFTGDDDPIVLDLDEMIDVVEMWHKHDMATGDGPIGIFPIEEVLEWTKIWYHEKVGTNWNHNGSAVVKSGPLLYAYLTERASNQSKRFKEVNRHCHEDTPAPF